MASDGHGGIRDATGRRRPPAQRRGMALPFVLVLADPRLRGARFVSCELDTISAVFPEVSISIEVCRLLRGSDGGLVLKCHAEHTAGADRHRSRRRWQRTLIGQTCRDQQRETVVRELLAARAQARSWNSARPELRALHVWAAAV